MISIPSLVRTASKSRVNLLSRSRIRKRNRPGCSWSVQASWRACWVNPGSGRVGGAASEVDAAAAEFDEEEHVTPVKRDRLDREEVDREHALRLCPQEGTPGGPGSRASRTEPRITEDLLDSRGGHPHAEPVQLAGDPLVTPAWVLTCQPEHQRADLLVDRRPTAATAVGPPASDDSSLPAQLRHWRNHERPPVRPRQQPTRCSEQDAIGHRELRSPCPTPEHRELVPQDDDLQLLTPRSDDEATRVGAGSGTHQVGERPDQKPAPRNHRDGPTTLRPTPTPQRREPG